jgi:hypothetical protein
MNIKFLKVFDTWRDVADAARTTIGMTEGTKDPSSIWKKSMLLAEHSPIRLLTIRWKWVNIKYWISVHIVRHKIGIDHFVTTQRTDRTGLNRDTLPQSNLVNHECIANAQSIINISRKRLCKQASPETRQIWIDTIENLKHKEPELYSVCVPECIYRGFCPEIKSCNWNNTQEYTERLNKYRSKELL